MMTMIHLFLFGPNPPLTLQFEEREIISDEALGQAIAAARSFHLALLAPLVESTQVMTNPCSVIDRIQSMMMIILAYAYHV